MAVKVEIKPCTSCGTPGGGFRGYQKVPFRSKQGWCSSCSSRGGKPNQQKPCIDCGTSGGTRRSDRKRGSYLVRIRGRCRDCYNRHIRKAEKEWCLPNREELIDINKCLFTTIVAKPVVQEPTHTIDLAALQEIQDSWKPDRKRKDVVITDAEQERRVFLMRCIQEYRAAEKKWKGIKAYKLDAAKETESVLLSA